MAAIKWNQAKLSSLRRNVVTGIIKLGNAIGNQARRNAPVDTGALVNSIRVSTDDNDEVYILAGGAVAGNSIPYAKRREYENNLHPSTKHYMSRAFESETKDITKYFKGTIK